MAYDTFSNADILQAELTTTVDRQNEEFVRSRHPVLSSHEYVWVSESVFGEPIWLVTSPVKEAYAGGRPIHFFPGYHLERVPGRILTLDWTSRWDAQFSRDINPRRFLTARDLDTLRELFPKAIGANVLIAGFVVILFEDSSALNNAYQETWPIEMAGLLVCFDIPRYDLERTFGEPGIGVRNKVNGSGVGCFGLKLRLRDDTTAITTVTHDFVYCPARSRIRNTIQLARLFLGRAKWSLSDSLTMARHRKNIPSNSPLDIEVYSPSTQKVSSLNICVTR